MANVQSGTDELTNFEGIRGVTKILTGILRNLPDGTIKIPYDDSQQFEHEQVSIVFVNAPTGSYLEVKLVDMRSR